MTKETIDNKSTTSNFNQSDQVNALKLQLKRLNKDVIRKIKLCTEFLQSNTTLYAANWVLFNSCKDLSTIFNLTKPSDETYLNYNIHPTFNVIDALANLNMWYNQSNKELKEDIKNNLLPIPSLETSIFTKQFALAKTKELCRTLIIDNEKLFNNNKELVSLNEQNLNKINLLTNSYKISVNATFPLLENAIPQRNSNSSWLQKVNQAVSNAEQHPNKKTRY